MEESLEELEHKYFMLMMADTWGREEHAYAEELRKKIKEAREKTNG